MNHLYAYCPRHAFEPGPADPDCRVCQWAKTENQKSAIKDSAASATEAVPADHKPNTPPTPTPKVEDSVVEVGGELGECDACHKEVPVDELTASDYESNGVADGDFCHACRNYDGIGPSGHDRHEEVRGER